MKIEKNRVVVICYEVESEGNLVDKMSEDKPLDYIQGTNMLLPKIESELEDKEEGYEFCFEVEPAEAYGEYDESRVMELPKSAFMVNGEVYEDVLKEGNLVPMFQGSGNVVYGKVLKVKEDVVAMDFNHPMAGKVLKFTGKVISVREATEKELTEGLHGEYLPREAHSCHGNCHCHSEGEGCHRHGEGESCDCSGEGSCHCHGEVEGCHCSEDREGCSCGHHE